MIRTTVIVGLGLALTACGDTTPRDWHESGRATAASDQVYSEYLGSGGNPEQLVRVIELAEQVSSSDPDYREILFIRAAASAILTSIYDLESFSIDSGSAGPLNVVSYASYFRSLFRGGSSPADRQTWQNEPVMVAASTSLCSDIGPMLNGSSNDIASAPGDWLYGARDPARPGVLFTVRLTQSDSLSNERISDVIVACDRFAQTLPALHNPRLVVVGVLRCREPDCTTIPDFLVTHLHFTYSSASMVPGYLDYLADVTRIMGRLRRAGVQ